MFYYLFLPLDQHFDSGFGVMGDAFKDAADRLDADRDGEGALSNSRLPICFLYRHSIELYIKSTIMILHRRFHMPGPDNKHDPMPTILVDTQGSTRPIHSVHSIEKLAVFLDAQRTYCKSSLDKLSKTIAQLPPDFFTDVRTIEAHDASSTYFRYPFTKGAKDDESKSSMQPVRVDDLEKRMREEPAKVQSFIFVDDDGSPVEAFHHDESALDEVFKAVKRLSGTLSNLHAGIRAELTGGL